MTRVWKTAARAAMADMQEEEPQGFPHIFQRILHVYGRLTPQESVCVEPSVLRAGGMPKKSKKKKEGTSGGPAEEEVWRPACMHNPCRHAVVPDQRRAIARLGGCRRTTTTRSSTSAQSAG